MNPPRRLDLVLYWHMHQPDYRDALERSYQLPWTYLHALKDYSDMAWHLEQVPDLPCVVNLVPSLVEQIQDYADQCRTGALRDPLLAALHQEYLELLDSRQRSYLLDACFRANHEKMIAPFPAYQHLYEWVKSLQARDLKLECYLSGQFFSDLLVWYHLAWTGESLRRSSPLLQRLMHKGILFSLADRRALFHFIGERIGEILPRYRALQERGQVELSTTPACHPILPLLLDFAAARETDRTLPLPQASSYPGGEGRARAQIVQGLTDHKKYCGREAQGMWPSEGALSTRTLELLAEAGCRWCATGETVLANSLRHEAGKTLESRAHWLYRPYRITTQAGAITCFFRDDLLSDKIGFEYARWNAEDAAQDFIQRLEAISRQSAPDFEPVVTIVLDGENAWEYYPYNGYYFLQALYRALSTHPYIRPTTFTRYLEALASRSALRGVPADQAELNAVVAGSWVYGTLTTWIGDPAKNRAWDLLVEAKQEFDRVMAAGTLAEETQRLAVRQLSVCEGSDWFWWLGDYNDAPSVQSFDHLFRNNLTQLYHLLDVPIPPALSQPLSQGNNVASSGGAMRRSSDPEV